jgi:hypothetical protein
MHCECIPTFNGNRNDLSNYTIYIRENIDRRVTKNLHPLRREPSIADHITPRTISSGMSLPIDLDSQPCRRTIEVEHIIARRMLLAKS